MRTRAAPHRRARLAAGAALLSLSLACERPAPTVGATSVSLDLPATPTASASAAPPAAERGPLAVKEQWRVEVPDAKPANLAADRYGVAVAWTFQGMLSLPRTAGISSAGEKDIVVSRLASTGVVSHVSRIGGPADDEVAGMAFTGDRVVLALTSDGNLTLAGTTLSPGPIPPGGLFPPAASAVVWLSEGDHPEAVHVLPPGARTIALGATPDGGVVVGASYPRGDETFGTSMVTRFGADHASRWTHTLDDVAVTSLTSVSSGVAAGLRGSKGLGLALFDHAGGPPTRTHRVDRASSYAGDLGDLAGVVELGGAVVAFGETGRNTVGGLSHTIEPFSLAMLAKGALSERRQLADVTGRVVGVGSRGDEAVFVLHVIHTGALYGGVSLPHRGVYVGIVDATGAPRFTPIYQVAYEDDDWEKGEKRVVRGKYLSPLDARVAGDRLYVSGYCDERGTTGCVVALALGQ